MKMQKCVYATFNYYFNLNEIIESVKKLYYLNY